MYKDVKVYEHYMQRVELLAKCAEAIEDRSGGETVTTREMWANAAKYLEEAIKFRNITITIKKGL